uniref:Uncharacterized protein n=1 Tax=Caenorhabditis japonica TaxID=281687 RepID=A0A8R1I941_CAEJA
MCLPTFCKKNFTTTRTRTLVLKSTAERQIHLAIEPSVRERAKTGKVARQGTQKRNFEKRTCENKVFGEEWMAMEKEKVEKNSKGK